MRLVRARLPGLYAATFILAREDYELACRTDASVPTAREVKECFEMSDEEKEELIAGNFVTRITWCIHFATSSMTVAVGATPAEYEPSL